MSCSITQNFQDFVPHDVHSLTTAVANEDRSAIYTIFEAWGIDRPPVQAPIERWAELAGSRYRGKVASTHASRRRWAEPDYFRPWEFELHRRSVS